MFAVALALAAACSWGSADFVGGLKTRSVGVGTVLLLGQATGLALTLVVIAATGEPWPGGRIAVLALVAGAAGGMALGALYRALAVGTMGVVAPISATGAALPVVVGLATGDRLSAAVAAGLVLVFAGVVLASRGLADDAPAARAGRAGVLLAVAAALGFGTYYAVADVVSDHSVLWLLALGRAGVVAVLTAVLLARRTALPALSDALPAVGAGVLDVLATGLIGVALRHGALSVVSVLGSLYPVATLLLARVVLGERLAPVQAWGVSAALAGVAVIVAA